VITSIILIGVAHGASSYFALYYDNSFGYPSLQCLSNGSNCEWVLTAYQACGGGTGTSSDQYSQGGTTGHPQGTVSANAGCGLVGWHADYYGGGNGCWAGAGNCNPSSTYQYMIDLNPPASVYDTLTNSHFPWLFWNGQVEVTSDSGCNSSTGSCFHDVYLDFWVYWTSPVGPNHLQGMEFLLELETTRCSNIIGCQGDYFNVGANAYQYFHRVHWIELNSLDYFSFSQTDMYNTINTAFSHWGLPFAGAYFTGFDYGEEAGQGASGSAFLNYISIYNCPNLNGYIGYNVNC